MTKEEAIKSALKNVNKQKDNYGFILFNADENQDVMTALGKQIPKKPLLEGDGYYDGEMVYDGWRCPNCDVYFEIDGEAYKYCPKCGQRIDWTGV